MTTTDLQVLLVEDSPDDADLLREMLRDAGAEVNLTVAETLRAARTCLDGGVYDLILLDLSLPDSSGLETVHRAIAAAPDVPIVVLTGQSDEALGVSAVHAGAQDYLVKGGTDARMLRRCINYAVERHHLLAAQSENALVWGALARASQTLLQAPNGKALPDRLCQVAIEELQCDCARTWILDPAATTYAPAAARPASARASFAGLQIPRSDLAAFVADGGEREAVCWLTPELSRRLPAAMLPDDGDGQRVLLLIFARDEEIIGLEVCSFRQSPPKTLDRISRGLVHLGTMTLSNARLVDQLEELNTIKTYFAATMSHELRGTLFAIAGYSEILADRLEGDADADTRRFARLISERAHESSRVIQASLELTRSELQPASPDAGELNVRDLVEQIANEVLVPGDREDLRFEWRVAELHRPLRTDPVKLKMILKNLIGNAVKFTERGRVELVVEPLDELLRFTVTDTGMGIDAAELPHLFEPFRQAHGRLSRRAGGAGLGLYIVNRLVVLLGGSVAVVSTPGVGTTFSVTLPLTPPTAAAAAASSG